MPDLLEIAALTNEESLARNSSAVTPSIGFCCSSATLPLILPRSVVCAVTIYEAIRNIISMNAGFRMLRFETKMSIKRTSS